MSNTKQECHSTIFEEMCDSVDSIDRVDTWLDEETRYKLCNKVNNFSLGDISSVSDCINLSSIASKLINEAGRWCDRYASDFIIDWDHVRRSIAYALSDDNNDSLKSNGFRETVLFGIRDSGIDHNSFVYSKMSDQHTVINDYYSRVYAVDIKIVYGDNHYCLTIDLKDIKSKVSSKAFDMRHS